MITRMLSCRKVGHSPRHADTSRRHDCHRRSQIVVAVAASSTSASFKIFRPPGARAQPSCPPLVHIPGADGTGVSLGRQAALLSDAGFDVWSSAFDFGGGDGESEKKRGGSGEDEEDPWAPLVAAADAAFEAAFGGEDGSPRRRRPSIVAESFGACLVLRLASRKPESFSSLVLINSATALSSSSSPSSSSSSSSSSSFSSGPSRSLSSTLVGVAAATGIARFLPVPVYRGAAAVLTPLLLDARAKSSFSSCEEEEEGEEGGSSSSSSSSSSALLDAARTMMSLGGGGVTRGTTAGVATRLELLARADPGPAALGRVSTRTLVAAGARDALLPSVSEAARLCGALPDARRLLLPDSGHAALLEGRLDLARELERAGFGAAAAAAAAAATGEGTAASSPSLSAPWSLSDPEFDGALESLRPLRELVSPLVTGGEFLEALGSPSAVAPPPPSPSPSSSPSPSTSQTTPAAAAKESPSNSRSSPILFVSNHSRYGIYDLVFVLAELYARGIKARGLAHKSHFDTGSPLGAVFKRFGAVAASPRSAFRLLAEGEAVLLFPGGAAEVNKGKGEDYRLLWKKEADFVRLAARFPGCKIVPFAAVGAEEAYDVILDQKEQLSNPVLGPLARAAFKALGLEAEEALPPLAALPFTGGLIPAFPVPLPRPERLYFEFCEPIDAAEMIRNTSPEETYARVRSEVEAAIERQRAVRAADPLRPTSARLREAAKRFLPRRLEF